MKANTLGRRSGVLLTILSSFWGAAPSCGGQSSHVEGSPARPPGPDAGGARELSGPARDLELYYASLHAATCDQAERCAREVGPSYASYADCMKGPLRDRGAVSDLELFGRQRDHEGLRPPRGAIWRLLERCGLQIRLLRAPGEEVWGSRARVLASVSRLRIGRRTSDNGGDACCAHRSAS